MRNTNEWYRNKRQSLIAAYGSCCQHCKGTERLEFAHAKETKLHGNGRGLNHRVLDVMGNPDCYVLLCHECHMKMDGIPA